MGKLMVSYFIKIDGANLWCDQLDFKDSGCFKTHKLDLYGKQQHDICSGGYK